MNLYIYRDRHEYTFSAHWGTGYEPGRYRIINPDWRNSYVTKLVWSLESFIYSNGINGVVLYLCTA